MSASAFCKALLLPLNDGNVLPEGEGIPVLLDATGGAQQGCDARRGGGPDPAYPERRQSGTAGPG